MLKLLYFAAGGYVFLVAFAYVSQARMLYLPDIQGRELTEFPDAVGLAWEEVNLETSDGVRVHSWFVPGATDRVLLYFHGNAGNISHRLHSIREFHDLGLSVFIIDYRGYGRSGGTSTEAGLYRDADTAWRYLTEDRGIAPQDVILFGRSLGGSVAAWLAMRESAGALIVDSAFTSVPDIGQEAYPWLPVRLLSRFRHPTGEYVTKSKCPVLVVHSRDDEIVPMHHGEAIFSAASEPKTFLEIRGGHNDAHARSAETYRDGIREFLDSL